MKPGGPEVLVPATRPVPQPASRILALRGTMASTRRASPTMSSPRRAMVRNLSMYHCECLGFCATWAIHLLCSTMGPG